MAKKKMTFPELRRRLTIDYPGLQLKTVGDVQYLRSYVISKMSRMTLEVTGQRVRGQKIQYDLRQAGIEQDSRIQDHQSEAMKMILAFEQEMMVIYERDISLIDAFLKDRSSGS